MSKGTGLKGLNKLRREQRAKEEKAKAENSQKLVDYIAKLEGRMQVLEHSMLKASGLIMLMQRAMDRNGLLDALDLKESEFLIDFNKGLNAGLTLITEQIPAKEEE